MVMSSLVVMELGRFASGLMEVHIASSGSAGLSGVVHLSLNGVGFVALVGVKDGAVSIAYLKL